ncbi:hypothetical protein M3J09_003621 [Ascochyta lentis]
MESTTCTASCSLQAILEAYQFGKEGDVTHLDSRSAIVCGVLHRKTGVGRRLAQKPWSRLDADRVEDSHVCSRQEAWK